MKRACPLRILHVEQLENRALPSVVSGLVFEDLNDNGQRDDGEPGRAGWEVRLLNATGVVIQAAVTSGDGAYRFENVAPGRYVVQETLPSGWRQTHPQEAAPAAWQPPMSPRAVPETISLRKDNPRVSDLLPDLIVDTENGLSDWYIEGNKLRFSQATPNIGAGPLILIGGEVLPDGAQEVFQRIKDSAGGHRERTAGFFAFHPQHGHVHFEGYSTYNLRRVLPDSNGDGLPERGDIVASGGKVSFCLLDLEVFDRHLPGFESRSRFNNCGQRQGISVGWEDVYDASLEGQEIDLTNVASGQYWLESIVDPENRVLELNETNNVSRILVTIPFTGRAGTYTIDVAGDQDSTGLDFGNFKYVTLSGHVFEDHDGDGLKELGDQGLADRVVYLDRNGNGRLDAGQLKAVSPNVPREIPDESTVTSAVSVIGGGTIADVNVSLSIDHTYTGDLQLFLISPLGARAELVHNRGENGRNFVQTVFDDEGTQSIATASAPFTGRFRPESSLTIFDGQDSDGLWTLEVQDNAGEDVGILQSWSLEITFAEPQVRTGAAGNFGFSALGLGTHRVRQVVPAGWRQTSTDPVDFVADTSGAVLAGVRFGAHNEPPQVVGVQVKPAGQPPVSIPVGSGVQLQPLLLGDIKQLLLTFSEPVNIKRGDLILSHVRSFRYDPLTFTATWILDRPLPKRLIELDLSDRVADLTGLALDGEWDNPSDTLDPVSSAFPSGDGVPGGRFVFRFAVGQAGVTGRQATTNAALMEVLLAERARRREA